jgi:CheY-like chemotaxis protein
MATTVLLVDDVEELRDVVRQSFRLRGGFDVVAEAGDGAAAIAAAREHQPDIVVLDLGLPDLAGHEVLTRLQTVAPAVQIVIYTGTMTEELPPPQQRVAAIVRKDRDVRYLVDLIVHLSEELHGAAVDLGPDLADVARARRFVAERCGEWGCHTLVDDAELVATELVTNALVHARTRCELRVRWARGILHIEVEDRGSGAPDLHVADDRAEHGRGLLIVSALCAAWGVDARPPAGKRVWAQLQAQPNGERPRSALADGLAPR